MTSGVPEPPGRPPAVGVGFEQAVKLICHLVDAAQLPVVREVGRLLRSWFSGLLERSLLLLAAGPAVAGRTAAERPGVGGQRATNLALALDGPRVYLRRFRA